nr:histone-lysine n-methyltransferase atxr3 [Quercus suber]
MQRKMRVSLPEDYAEKLYAQKSGTGESDMELPDEVKDYKTRKLLGDEVIEQEAKDDVDGYDLVVIDAMRKANYASLICHSCRPNCEAKFTAVDVHY